MIGTSAYRKCRADDVKFSRKLFPEDFKDSDDLIAEIDLLASDIRVQSKEDDLRLAAKVLCGIWHAYPNLCKAYQIALTVPITVASNERSFSLLKLVKSYLRSTMTENCLDDLMIITCESDIADELDLDQLANSWLIHKMRRVSV